MNRHWLKQIQKVLALTVSLILCFGDSVYTLPEISEVVSGSAQIQQIDANTLSIEASDNTVINYSSFNINEGESVIVKLPSDSSQLLNRVLGDGASQLLGNLNSNGLFILVNHNGIYIGTKANIDASNLVISTRDITNQDFMAGSYFFQKLSSDQLDMLLLNEGKITLKQGGFGVLVAGAVENKGAIVAPIGKIALAAGDAIRLDIAGGGLIGVAIENQTASQITDYDGKPITNQLSNTGSLEAENGVVMLNAESLPQVFLAAINLGGVVRADKAVEGANGEIILSSNAPVNINGTVSASQGTMTITADGISEVGNIENTGKVSFNAAKGGQASYNLKTGSKINASGDVSIGSNVTLHGSDAQINVGGSWVNAGNFEGDTSSVDFTGTSEALILGDNTFYNFTAIVPNKVLKFEAGKTQTILGTWKTEGAYGQHVRLVSTEAGNQWIVDPRGARDLTYTWVENSHNVNSKEIVMTESTNRGNSPGWDPTGTWIGAAGGSWSTASNWSGLGGATPGAGDDLRFNSTTNTASVVDASFAGSIGSMVMLSGYTATISLARSLTITDASGRSGSLTINAGTLDLAGNNLTVEGTFSNSSVLQLQGGETVTFTNDTDSGGVVYNGSGTYSSLAAGNNYWNVNFNGTGTWKAAAAVDINNNFTITSGTVDLNGYNLDVTGATYSNAAGTLRLQGAETLTGFTNDTDSGILEYTGSSTYNSLIAGNNYYILTFNGTGTWNAAANVDVNYGLTITQGTFDLSGYNLDLTGATGGFSNSGTLQLQGAETLTAFTNDTDSGTVVYDGTSSYSTLKAGDNYYNLTMAGSGSFTAASDTRVTGTFTQSAGTFIAPGSSNDFRIAGNFAHSGGTFTARSGTVSLTGTDQTITGSTTFNNLTKLNYTDDSTDDTLTFEAGSTQTITGTLTLRGTDDNDRVNLYSSVTGTQWNLVSQGSLSINYVRVRDSNASGGNIITALNAANSGNNTNWQQASTLSIAQTVGRVSNHRQSQARSVGNSTIAAMKKHQFAKAQEMKKQNYKESASKSGTAEAAEETQVKNKELPPFFMDNNPYKFFGMPEANELLTKVSVTEGRVYVQKIGEGQQGEIFGAGQSIDVDSTEGLVR